jgi:SAM-dependent methyltransferase
MWAQAAEKEYEPVEGQSGKDVIWLPTAQELGDKMLDIAKLTPEDFVIDLGSGDGHTVITAAKRGARALGIEYNPDMVAFSKRNVAKAGVAEKTQFMEKDLFETDFSQATVLTMFLMPDINLKLRPQILDLKPGTRVVSNTFTMGDWNPDETATVDDKKTGCGNYCTALLWIVPAKVEGAWKLPQGELTLKQSYQMLSGTFKSGNNNVPVTNGKMTGDLITFSVGNINYTGRVRGNSMEGTFQAWGSSSPWSAARVREG